MLMSRAAWRRDLESLYATPEGDASFASLLARNGDLDDEALAELIETDGRARLAAGRDVPLDRYLSAVPDLPSRLEPLDAAIDVALRGLAGTGTIDAWAVERLIASYPTLERAIRESAALNNAIWSTTGLRAMFTGQQKRDLPCGFGPPLEDGEPRYELRELLGSGGYGEVYLATDRLLSEADRPALVAIKVLSARHDGPWSRQRFMDEATKARRIDHPNVVRVYDRGVGENEELFIVYEYISGGDMGRWFASLGRPLPVRQATELVAKIARGVHAAHAAGVIHCDLKPGNILRTPEGDPKVADFGIAARLGEEDLDANGEEPRPLGNLAFIAPEQLRMEDHALHTASDVYALGGILYYLLTTRLPNGSTVEEIRDRHRQGHRSIEAAEIRRECPGVSRELAAVIARALAPRPQDRYDSASALADDLEACLRKEPVRWTRPGLARLGWLWVQRKPWHAATAAVAGFAAAALTATIYWYSGVLEEESHIAAQATALAQKREQQNATARESLAAAYRAVKQGYLTGEAEPENRGYQLLDWLAAQTVPGAENSYPLRDVDRIAAIRQRLRLAEEEGRGAHLDTLLTRATLATWLIAAGDHTAAEPLVRELRAVWSGMLPPDDLWLHQLDALAACAAAGRLAALAESGPLTPDQQAEAATVRRSLDELLALLTSPGKQSPVTPLIHDARERFDLAVPPAPDSNQKQTP